MQNQIIVNGKKLPYFSKEISTLDAGFHYGFGVYETFFIKESLVCFYKEHIQRLKTSLNYLKIDYDEFFFERIKQFAKELIQENNIRLGRMRLTISPGIWELPELHSEKITFVLSVSPILKTPDSVKLMISDYKKPLEIFLPPFVKVTGNFPSILSYKEAKQKNFDEGILLRSDGIVTEGSFCNVFWIDRKGEIRTPSLNSCILDGVTRAQILESAKSKGIKILEGEYSKDDLHDCKFLFISSSTRGLLQASQLNDRLFKKTDSAEIHEIIEEYKKRENESLKQF